MRPSSPFAARLLLLALTACAPGDGDPADTDVSERPDLDGPGTIPDSWPVDDIERVVFFGDSITAGVGASKGTREYPSLMRSNDREAWPDWSGGALATRFSDLEGDILDVSRGGAVTGDLDGQTTQLLARLGGAPADGPTLVIATIGGNDAQQALLQPANAETILATAQANIEDWVAGLRDGSVLTGRVEILIANIYEPSDGTGQSDACFFGYDYSSLLPTLAAYNADLGAWAEGEGIAIADLRGHFLGHGFIDGAGDDLWFADDCIHPNDRGHHEIRRLFLGALDNDPLDTRRAEGDTGL